MLYIMLSDHPLTPQPVSNIVTKLDTPAAVAALSIQDDDIAARPDTRRQRQPQGQHYIGSILPSPIFMFCSIGSQSVP